MKLVSIIMLITGLLSMSVFDFSQKQEEQQTAQSIAKLYFSDFRQFQKSVNELAALNATPAEEINLQMLRDQIAETRFAFKKIEYLFDYRQTAYNYLNINGGPLPKLDEETSGREVIPPNGLQTLDEVIFSADAADQMDHIKQLADDLKNALDFIAKSHFQITIEDHQVIEALRSGIVRVFTLGLTGFDTPGSANAIAEALVSMQTMEKTFLLFEENVKTKAAPTFEEIKKSYQKGIEFLKANDNFDTLDRMFFLKQVANPLYEKLKDFQVLNEIDTSLFYFHAQDYQARNLFDENFLNKEFYSEFSFKPLNDPEIIELGKTLFYDPILSGNGKMSCATCHDPKKAFSDGLPKSKTNVPGVFTKRNSPTLIDAGLSSRYFWDMREYNLERQIAHVVNDSLEFNIGFGEIAKRLNQSATYVEWFDKIYHKVAKRTIYSRSISNAIAAYVNSLTSFNSQFDQFARNEISNYPESAIRGFNLFMGKAACGTCHFAPAFNGSVPPFFMDSESEVLGITLGLDTLHPQKDQDPGRMQNGLRREARPYFENSFKTVTVRNAALTAPYMHNGLFKTLEEVMEFYNKGGGAGMGLDIDNQTLSDVPLNLSENEKSDIITFLQTLTDTTGLTNQSIVLPKFENRPEWNNRGKKGDY